MPAFFVIAIAAGALTVGATATDAKRWMHTDPKTAEAFYQSTFDSKADCLTAAALVKVATTACGSEED
jgi:hypothetical protein